MAVIDFKTLQFLDSTLIPTRTFISFSHLGHFIKIGLQQTLKAFSHHYYQRGGAVWSARRAHNPEVAWFKSRPRYNMNYKRNKKNVDLSDRVPEPFPPKLRLTRDPGEYFGEPPEPIKPESRIYSAPIIGEFIKYLGNRFF